jgi:co-chaperonin GroES (HSP10)
MGILKVTNNNVFVIRDKTEGEKSGLILPSAGREKPSEGTIFGVGNLVKDPDIKRGKNRKCLFHKGVGQEIEYKGVTYVNLDASHIIAIV